MVLSFPCYLTHLPEEITIHIALYLRVPDVLSWKQTCRFFLGVLESKYLWLQLMSTVQFRSSFISHLDINKLSAEALQDAAIKTLRLERNWRRKTPILHRVFPIQHDSIGSFDQMKFLSGAETLIAVRRESHGGSPSFQICVFSLSDPSNAYEVATFRFMGIFGDFDVAMANDTKSFIAAFTVRIGESSAIEVYRFLLPDASTSLRLRSSAHSALLRIPSHGTAIFHKMTVCGDFVAALICFPWDHTLWPSSRVVIANWRTGQHRFLDPMLPQVGSDLSLRLFPDYLLIVQEAMDRLELSVASIQTCLPRDWPVGDNYTGRWQNKHPIPLESTHVPVSRNHELHLSEYAYSGTATSPPILSLLTFPTFSEAQTMQRTAIWMSLQFSHNIISSCGKLDLSNRSSAFKVSGERYPTYVQLGVTGRRAVWLDQDPGSEDVRVLRLDHDPAAKGTPSIEVLLPPQPDLPFKPGDCRTLAFDEATGRLCLGVFSGGLFILDYA